MSDNPLPEMLGPLPHSVEAERTVLSAMMEDVVKLGEIASALQEIDFYRMEHRLIYRAIRELSDADSPVDAVTLANWFDSRDLTDFVGGFAYLQQLTQPLSTTFARAEAIELMTSTASARRTVEACIEIIGVVTSERDRPLVERLQWTLQKLHDAVDDISKPQQTAGSIRHLLKEAFQALHQRFAAKLSVTGLRTGIDGLDKLTNGFQPADLIVLASRPGMGKTALAMSIVGHVTTRLNKAVAIFTLETAASKLTLRLISALGEVDREHLRSGEITEDGWARIARALSVLAEAKVFIDDDVSLSFTALRHRACRLKAHGKLDLIVVDHFQLLRLTAKGIRASELSRSLKALANELNVPVLLLSRLNQTADHRGKLRPSICDLHTGLAEDADVILLLYREGYYDPRARNPGQSELMVEKQRNGPRGVVPLQFQEEYSRFTELDELEK